ncbi:MAG TPA: hypothetical protein VGM51_16665 [Armatimonadota bacterium]|jgi:hypothetical protein
MSPKGPGSLPRLFAHDNALQPVFGRAARAGGVGNDVLDVKDNKSAVITPADSIPEAADAHARAWKAFNAQDFDGAVKWFKRAIAVANAHDMVAYKSENTLGLVFTAMADWDAALRQTSRMKRLIAGAEPALQVRFRLALHTNRGTIYSRRASREADATRRDRFLRFSYREHRIAAAICRIYTGDLDTERAWNLADSACRLKRWDETARVLGTYLPRNPQLSGILNTNSHHSEWPTFLSLYHEDAAQFIRSNPEAYRTGGNQIDRTASPCRERDAKTEC